MSNYQELEMKSIHIQKKTFRFKPANLVVLAALTLFLQACSYSIIISNKRGTPEPDPMNAQEGFYHFKQVTVVDTVVKLGIVEDGVIQLQNCPAGGLHSVEYKITFGAILRNTFTFGKRKSIKVKCVCLKDSNQ